jgi:DNA-binding MarR family transcriptional regulator
MQLIGRERDAEDRRHVTARITRKGLEILKKVEPGLLAVQQARLGGLSERTLASLISGLAAMREGR